MQPAILAGDFIMVEKLTYGARIFTGLKFDQVSDPPLIRLPGTGKIQHNDVVVFNFPYRQKKNRILMHTGKYYTKRCIGLPGDTLEICNGYYHIRGTNVAIGYFPEQEKLAAAKRKWPNSVFRTFPKDSLFLWNILDFGPLYIPVAGSVTKLTPGNYILYRKMIEYETKKRLRKRDTSYFMGDSLITHYTFTTNWYFMAGDQVSDSQDSRYFGLVPEAYIVGRAVRVISSKDPYTGERRWKRIFKIIR